MDKKTLPGYIRQRSQNLSRIFTRQEAKVYEQRTVNAADDGGCYGTCMIGYYIPAGRGHRGMAMLNFSGISGITDTTVVYPDVGVFFSLGIII